MSDLPSHESLMDDVNLQKEMVFVKDDFPRVVQVWNVDEKRGCI